MTRFSSLHLLAALGVLSLSAAAAAQAVDTSAWTCETCPFEKDGVSGAVEASLAVVDDRAARYGDFTGLSRQGGYLWIDGEWRWRAAGGWWADAAASTERRRLDAQGGREGVFGWRLGYAEIPRHLADDARTPFLGVGSATLTLPAGYPAGSTAAMPLAGTLRGVDLSSTRQRLDLAASLPMGREWSTQLSLRRDVRDGLQPGSGSFFASAAQLPIPIDQVTDQLELSTHYRRGAWQATLGYQISQFRNAVDGLRWANPFVPVVAGATTGQLALAPDNTLHQLSGSAGYVHSPRWRVSADFALGRLTQDEPFLAVTQNPLITTVALPRSSLQGRVDTYSGTLRLTVSPMDTLRVHGVLSHQERDNRTPVTTLSLVSTDMFPGGTVTSTPYSYVQDKGTLTADFRGPGSLRLAGGVEYVMTNRTWQEASDTQEGTAWLRVRVRPLESLHLTARVAHAERTHDGYGIATWISPAENPLLRKFNLADRQRNTARLSADLALSETVQLGLHGDWADDDYTRSPLGLVQSRSASLGADASVALNDSMSVSAYAQFERIRSQQRGSSAFSTADWSGLATDRVDTSGVQARYLQGKLTLTADLSTMRSRSRAAIEQAGAATSFPQAGARRETLKLTASYALQDNLTLLGSFWHERYAAVDWHLDGVGPATVPNLLTLGIQPPNYSVQVLRAAVHYRF